MAVNEGNTNYEMWLSDRYPTWKRAYFPDTPAGLEAVAAGGADCVIISNYRYNNISRQCEKLHLTTVYTGVDLDYCFALRKGDIELYSILARVAGAVPDAVVHTALTYYSTEDVKTSFSDLHHVPAQPRLPHRRRRVCRRPAEPGLREPGGARPALRGGPESGVRGGAAQLGGSARLDGHRGVRSGARPICERYGPARGQDHVLEQAT